MDIKNHNMNKEKPIMRKRFRIIAFLAFFFGIIMAVSQYFEFVSKTVYEESVSHLTEVFHQSDNMLGELTHKNLMYLHMWSEYLQDAPSESKIRDYIDKAQKDAGFLYFYFLSADGNYKMTTGETGYLGLQENIEDEIQKGNDIITNAAVPGKSQMLVFASPKAHGSYQGFNMRIQFDSWRKEFILSVKHESVAKVRLGADALGLSLIHISEPTRH